MKENWINDMKRQLEGHKMEPPKGLWESISSQMGQPSGMKSPSRRTGMAQWYWAAAVVLAQSLSLQDRRSPQSQSQNSLPCRLQSLCVSSSRILIRVQTLV